jgi:hypothetical protein
MVPYRCSFRPRRLPLLSPTNSPLIIDLLYTVRPAQRKGTDPPILSATILEFFSPPHSPHNHTVKLLSPHTQVGFRVVSTLLKSHTLVPNLPAARLVSLLIQYIHHDSDAVS